MHAYENDFPFIVDPDCSPCPSFVGDFLSAWLSKLREFVIAPSDRRGDFGSFLSLGAGYSENFSFFRSISV